MIALPNLPWKPSRMGNRFDPSDRHSDDLIGAIDRAASSINHTLREGFKLLVAEIKASSSAPDNSTVIEAQVKKLENLTTQLNQSRNP
jgi:hypothetical protein